MDRQKQKTSFFETRFYKFWRRHYIVAMVLIALFIASFFVRGSSVMIQYTDEKTFDYVRIDYSIYGYCIGVKPLAPTGVESAKDLTKQLLFCDMDTSVRKVVDRWVYYYGNEETFKLKLKGFTFNTNKRRDRLIDDIRALGYKADAIAL